MSESSSYLSKLAEHAIFALPTSSPPSSTPAPVPALDGPRKRVVVRGSDLILAVGNEIRLCSLSDAKARCDSSPDQVGAELELGLYKLIKTTTVQFDIHQLILNPSGKLLAVVGQSEVVVVMLPRKGWASGYATVVECR